MSDSPDTSERLKALREAAGLTQDDLAGLAKVSRSLVAKIENGLAKSVSSATVSALASGFGVPEEMLLRYFSGEGDMKHLLAFRNAGALTRHDADASTHWYTEVDDNSHRSAFERELVEAFKKGEWPIGTLDRARKLIASIDPFHIYFFLHHHATAQFFATEMLRSCDWVLRTRSGSPIGHSVGEVLFRMVIAVGDELHARGSGMSVDEYRTQVADERAEARYVFENVRSNSDTIDALRRVVETSTDEELKTLYGLPGVTVRRAATGALDPRGYEMRRLIRRTEEIAAEEKAKRKNESDADPSNTKHEIGPDDFGGDDGESIPF